jgi:hypothetical protein
MKILKKMAPNCISAGVPRIQGGPLPGALGLSSLIVVALSSFRTPADERIRESIEKAGAQLHQRESPRKGGNLPAALVVVTYRRSSLSMTPASEPIDENITKNLAPKCISLPRVSWKDLIYLSE